MIKSGQKMVSMRNKSSIHRTAYMVATEINRGQATIDKIQTVLTDIHNSTGVRNIQKISPGQIEQYLQNLIERVEDEKLTKVTAATYVSALNTALQYADRDDLLVSAKAHGLSKGQSVPTDLSNSRSSADHFLSFCPKKQHQTKITRL